MPVSPDLARFVLPLATYFALASLGAAQLDPAGAAEARFLALYAGGVMAAVTALATRPWTAGTTALAVVAAVWTLPDGPPRAAVATLLLGLGLAIAAAERWRREGGALQPRLTIPLALGTQLLARGDLLLPPLTDGRTLVSVVILPVAVGLALSVLARSLGSGPVSIAGAATVVLAPGWNLTTTTALVGLAAGAVAFDAEQTRGRRIVAALVLASPLYFRPLAGLLAALAALLLFAVRGRRGWIATAWVAALVAALTAFATLAATAESAAWLPAARDGPATAALLLLAVLLLPAWPAAIAKHPRWLIAGAVLILAGARFGAGADALAPGVALAALALPSRGGPGRLQSGWSGALVAGTLLLAGYPWMRKTPLADILALLGLEATPLETGPLRSLVPLVTLVLLITAGGIVLDRLRPWTLRKLGYGGGAGILLVFAWTAAMLPGLPLRGELALAHKVVLSSERAGWGRPLTPPPRSASRVAMVVLDTNLIHSLALAPDTPVAVVELLDAERQPLASWLLRAGRDSAEWAVARPDVAARLTRPPPPPWLSTLAPDGTFFARRFRTRLTLETPVAAAAVRVRRLADLPAATQLALYQVELRP